MDDSGVVGNGPTLGDRLRQKAREAGPDPAVEAPKWVDDIIRSADDAAARKARSISEVVHSVETRKFPGDFKKFQEDYAPVGEEAVRQLNAKGGIHNVRYNFTKEGAKHMESGGETRDFPETYNVTISFDW